LVPLYKVLVLFFSSFSSDLLFPPHSFVEGAFSCCSPLLDKSEQLSRCPLLDSALLNFLPPFAMYFGFFGYIYFPLFVPFPCLPPPDLSVGPLSFLIPPAISQEIACRPCVSAHRGFYPSPLFLPPFSHFSCPPWPDLLSRAKMRQNG